MRNSMILLAFLARVPRYGFLLAASPLLLLMAQCPQDPVVLPQYQNNTQPVARAGADGIGSIGTPIALDGTASYDPDGDEIVFEWSVDSKPADSQLVENPFSSNGTRNAGLTTVTPDVAGVYSFALVVTDPDGLASARDYVVYAVNSEVEPPVAEAGTNGTGLEGSSICLDGSNSHDPGGRPLTFAWTLVSVPANSSLTTADLVATDAHVCVVPDAPGTFAISLVVNNGLVDSEPDYAFVAAGSTNQGPTALAGILSAFSCDFVTLTGEDSTDPEGDPLHYSWDMLLVPSGSQVPLGQAPFDDPHAATPRFYADLEGEYTLQLVVDDGEDWSTPVFLELDLTEQVENTAPQVVTSPDAYFQGNAAACSVDAYGNCTSCPNCPTAQVPMDALGTTDPDGDTVHITWSLLTSPGNTGLDVEEGWENTLTMPGPPSSCTGGVTTYTAQVAVTATDCQGASSTGLVTVVYDCQ